MNFLMELLSRAYELIRRLAEAAVGAFLDLNIFEKIIVLATVPALIGVAAPVGRYFIFESYFYINNPLAVYMIGIVILMFVLKYLPAAACMGARLFLNAYYLFWLVYLHVSGELSKAPYELTAGFYLSATMPVLFMTASLLSYILYRNE
jgi:hypothetical protein